MAIDLQHTPLHAGAVRGGVPGKGQATAPSAGWVEGEWRTDSRGVVEALLRLRCCGCAAAAAAAARARVRGARVIFFGAGGQPAALTLVSSIALRRPSEASLGAHDMTRRRATRGG